MIRKVDGKYQVIANSGRNMGNYTTRKAAEARLAQVERFKTKHKKKTKKK